MARLGRSKPERLRPVNQNESFMPRGLAEWVRDDLVGFRGETPPFQEFLTTFLQDIRDTNCSSLLRKGSFQALVES